MSSPPQLPTVRDLQLVSASDDMGLTRLVAWLTEVLSKPTDVCDVAALPAHVYLQLARKMHVKYEGPPSSTTSAATSPGPSAGPSIPLRMPAPQGAPGTVVGASVGS